jgi:hypothetical protein
VELCRTGSRASCPASGDIPLGESGMAFLVAAQKQSLAEALLPTPLIGLSLPESRSALRAAALRLSCSDWYSLRTTRSSFAPMCSMHAFPPHKLCFAV